MDKGGEWKKPVFTKASEWFKTIGCGLCVGAADIVPGISGGTVAFIIGIYEDLLKSIASFNAVALTHLIKGRFKAFFTQLSWHFLLAFLLGVGISFVTLAKVFTLLLNHEVYRIYLYAGFLGLVLGSVAFCARQLANFRFSHFISLALAACVAFFLSGTDLIPKKNEPLYDVPIQLHSLPAQASAKIKSKTILNYDPISQELLNVPQSYLSGMLAKKFLPKGAWVYSHETRRTVKIEDIVGATKTSYIDLWVVLCGAIAISAMLLPGISGSYLLTILGMYGVILGALVDWVEGLKMLSFDFNAFRTVLSMVVGIGIGALLFSRVVSYLLAKYHDLTLAALVGFMIGALRAVWPFWSYEYALSPLRLNDGPIIQAISPIIPNVASPQFLIACAFLGLGFFLVLAVESFAKSRVSSPKTEILHGEASF